MTCTCLDDFDAKLEAHNTRLQRTIVMRPPGGPFPTIAVEKIKPRGPKPVLAIPTFCPFCGLAYAQRTDDQQEQTDAR